MMAFGSMSSHCQSLVKPAPSFGFKLGLVGCTGCTMKALGEFSLVIYTVTLLGTVHVDILYVSAWGVEIRILAAAGEEET